MSELRTRKLMAAYNVFSGVPALEQYELEALEVLAIANVPEAIEEAKQFAASGKIIRQSLARKLVKKHSAKVSP